MRAFVTWVVRRRRLVLGLGFVLTLALGAGILRLRVEVDPDRSLPQEHPHIVALEEMHQRFGDKNLVVIGLFPRSREPFTPSFLARVQSITDGLERIPGIVRPLLQSVASPAMKDVQPTLDGISVDPLMDEVPETQAEADAVRQRVLSNPDYLGTLVSNDAQALAIYATVELTPELPAFGDLHRAVLEVLTANDDGSFTWALSGPVVLASAVADSSARVAFFFPLALIVIALVHFDAFRTLQAMVLPLLTAILAVAWAVGLMGWLRVPLDPFNATTPILILAVAAGHAVQILKRFYEELERLGDCEQAVIASLTRMGPVMVASGTIAALSFLSLTTFDVEAVRTFGVFTALGILSTLAIELTIVPALRAALPPPADRERIRERSAHVWLDRWLLGLADYALGRGAIRITASLAALLVVCGILATRVEVDTSFKRQFSSDSPVFREDDLLNERFSGTSTLIFLIEAPSEGGIAEPASLAAIDRFERRFAREPGVGKALSVVGRIRTLHRALAAGTGAGDLPDTKQLATQYLFLYGLSGGDDLETIVTADNRIAKVVFLLRDDSTRRGKAMIAKAEAILAEELPPGFAYRVTGTLASNGALTEVMVEGKLENIAQIALVAIAVASLLLRSLLCGLLVAVPLALAVAVNFAVMGISGTPLDVVTSSVAAMSVGIGADYAVYFLFRLREEYGVCADFREALRATLATSGKAILFVSTAISAGYAILCLSGFAIHVQLGGLVALAMVTSSVSTLVGLSALASLLAGSRFRESLLPGAALDASAAPLRRTSA